MKHTRRVDAESMLYRCQVPGCGEVFQSLLAAYEHARAMDHGIGHAEPLKVELPAKGNGQAEISSVTFIVE